MSRLPDVVLIAVALSLDQVLVSATGDLVLDHALRLVRSGHHQAGA